jgi:hypothetical protein
MLHIADVCHSLVLAVRKSPHAVVGMATCAHLSVIKAVYVGMCRRMATPASVVGARLPQVCLHCSVHDVELVHMGCCCLTQEL